MRGGRRYICNGKDEILHGLSTGVNLLLLYFYPLPEYEMQEGARPQKRPLPVAPLIKSVLGLKGRRWECIKMICFKLSMFKNVLYKYVHVFGKCSLTVEPHIRLSVVRSVIIS